MKSIYNVKRITLNANYEDSLMNITANPKNAQRPTLKLSCPLVPWSHFTPSSVHAYPSYNEVKMDIER